MVKVHPILYRESFYSGSYFNRVRAHHQVIVAKCCPVEVTPAELAVPIDGNGEIDPYEAAALVYTLITRAQEKAVAKTIGMEKKAQPEPATEIEALRRKLDEVQHAYEHEKRLRLEVIAVEQATQRKLDEAGSIVELFHDFEAKKDRLNPELGPKFKLRVEEFLASIRGETV